MPPTNNNSDQVYPRLRFSTYAPNNEVLTLCSNIADVFGEVVSSCNIYNTVGNETFFIVNLNIDSDPIFLNNDLISFANQQGIEITYIPG